MTNRTYWLYSNCGNGWLDRGIIGDRGDGRGFTLEAACDTAVHYAEHTGYGRCQVRVGDMNSSFPRNIMFETLVVSHA